MIVGPDDNLSQKKWIREACDRLEAAFEPKGPFYINPAEWKLIRDREPVGGWSDVTEVFQSRIEQHNQRLASALRVIRKGDCGSARWAVGQWPRQKERIPRAENAPGYMLVLTDWQTLGGPGMFVESYADVLYYAKEHGTMLSWQTSAKIEADDDSEWYFTEQPLPHDQGADFVLFIPPKASITTQRKVTAELYDYGGAGTIYPVVITEWFGPVLT